MADWIDDFMSMTETVRSPESFRLWTAITTLSSAMERKIWTETDVDRLYPNMYTILTGGPASGKTIMVTTAKKLLATLVGRDGIYLGPDNPNKATFLDELENAKKTMLNGAFLEYSAMAVMCMELGVLISKYDKEFVADLTTLYDNPDTYSAPRRVAKSIALEAPTVNILAAATPDAIGDIMPETAWGQGFTSRLVFVYGTAPDIIRSIFTKRKDKDLSSLEKTLKEFYNEVHGEVTWEDPAQRAMEHWFNVEKMKPVPDYARLVNYCGRRDAHVMKLAMISAVSAGHGTIVTLNDFLRGKKWLLEVEKTMPDVFRAMALKSDAQILHDAHYAMRVKFASVDPEKRKPLTEKEVWDIFKDKCPHDKIDGLIKTMARLGYIRPGIQTGSWIPNPLMGEEE